MTIVQWVCVAFLLLLSHVAKNSTDCAIFIVGATLVLAMPRKKP